MKPSDSPFPHTRSHLRHLTSMTASLMAAICWMGAFVPGPAIAGEVSETEPNDDVNHTKFLGAGQFGKGVITYSSVGPVYMAEGDFWRILVPTGGDLVFAFVDGSESAGSSDTTIELVNFNFSTLEG